LTGQTISHYKIIEKLGGGGMGVVYKAEDTRLDRFVALKFLPPHLSTDEEAKQRFIAEAKAASALDHPNIGTIHEINETDDGQMYIVMTYYDGETLKKKVSSAQLSVTSAVEIAIQIAQGLARAHEAGITHRDIKPANIMITNRDEVKIVDFGLAKTANIDLTKYHTTLGTAAYMSQEQARGEIVDHRTDIWSLGVVLYEMLTGQLPFGGEYEQAIVYSIVNEEPQPVSELRDDVPTELQAIINKALAKNADLRYQQIDEMLADLNAVQNRLASTGASPLQQTKRLLSQANRRVWVPLLGLFTVAILFVLFFLSHPFRNTQAKVSSIAVMPFQYEGKESDWKWLGGAITDLLSTNLTQNASIRVLDAQRLRTAIKNLGFRGDTLSREQVFEIARQAKTENIIMGSLQKTEDIIGKTYEKMAKFTQAKHAYEEGMTIWYEADEELPDLIETKARMKRLKSE
jgi:serine/threonine protein kinase